MEAKYFEVYGNSKLIINQKERSKEQKLVSLSPIHRDMGQKVQKVLYQLCTTKR